MSKEVRIRGNAEVRKEGEILKAARRKRRRKKGMKAKSHSATSDKDPGSNGEAEGFAAAESLGKAMAARVASAPISCQRTGLQGHKAPSNQYFAPTQQGEAPSPPIPSRKPPALNLH